MSILFPFLPFDQDETPISFATRLASLHIGSSVAPFLRDIGVKAEELLGCEDDALKRLAFMSGVEVVDLQRNSARRLGKRWFNLRGNLLSSEFFASPNTVFCPACLRRDDERGIKPALARCGRLIWTLRPVRTCPIHSIGLLRRKKVKWDDAFHQLALRVPERAEALDELVETAERQSPSPLQNYIVARLSGAKGPNWLDSQTLEQAVCATEMLGVLLEFGADAETGALNEKHWEAAGRSGYAVTSGGESDIRDALQAIRKEFVKKGGKPALGNVLGHLYRSLASRKNPKDPGDIKRIVREHIFDTVDLPAGAEILGEVLTERRLHSVASLASETGIHPETMRNVLAAKGLIPIEDKVSHHHVFEAAAGREVSAAVQRSTQPKSLPEALNCTRSQAGQLVDERLLDPIVDGAMGAIGRTRKAIYDRDIMRFLASLHARARVVEELPAGMVSIAKAAEKAKLTCIEIVHLVLCGFAENVVRLAGIEGYAAIYVDPTELRLRKAEHLPGMSAFDTFGKLKLPRPSGWALVERKTEPKLKPIVVEGLDGQHRFFRFEEECVTSFASKYTTEPRVANMNNIQVENVQARLKGRGVKPALGKIDIGVDLYRAADMPSFEMA